MSQQATVELVDRWMNDPGFKQEMRNDAEGAVRRHGFHLDDEEMGVLRSIDWTLPDEELQERISRHYAASW